MLFLLIAALDKRSFDSIASACKANEEHGRKENFPLPWNSFVQDVKGAAASLFAKFQPRRLEFKKVRRNLDGPKGSKWLSQGDAVRGALHRDQFYGCIQLPKDKGVQNSKQVFVISKSVSDTGFKEIEDFDSIVDKAVRETVKSQVAAYMQEGKSFSDAIQSPIWMNREKRIPIRKVRCVAQKKTGSVRTKASSFRIPIRLQIQILCLKSLRQQSCNEHI